MYIYRSYKHILDILEGKMYFIGTDVGTTGTKTIIVDENGKICGKGYQEYELIAGKGGVVEQNAEDWWKAVVYSVNEAVKTIDNKDEIVAMSLSTQGGTILPVDENFKPLCLAYTWMDERAVDETAALKAKYGEEIYERSGWRCSACFDPARMLWMKANDPDSFNNARSFVSTVEYVNYMLTGKNITDPSNAAMRQLINVETADWDDVLIEAAGLTRERLPQLLPTGAFVGTLTQDAAKALNIPMSVKVYNGAHDQYCASLGCGAVKPGEMLLSTGTTWVILGVSDKPLFTASHIAPGVHPVKGLYGNITSLNSAGSALKWYKQIVNEEFPVIDDGSADRMESAENIFFYPYFAGSGFPHHIPEVKACCMGLELMHDKYDLARALMEGIAFETRESLAEFAANGTDIKKLKMVGGAAKSELWSQITCDVTGCELHIPAEKDTCCIGAAMLAATGYGYFKDFLEATEKMVCYSKVLKPNPKAAEFYDKKFAKYHKGFEMLKEFFCD